jgi:hypothetical protein
MSNLKMISMVLLMCTMLAVILCSARAVASPPCYSRDGASLLAEKFVQDDATFKFDGMADTLSIRVEHVNSLPEYGMALALPLGQEYTFKAKFDSRHSGYGDRTGKVLAQVVTPHVAVITMVGCKIESAIMDGKWDMLKGDIIL